MYTGRDDIFPFLNKRHPADMNTAIYLLEAGSNIRIVQELLIHKDVKATMFYTHVHNRRPELEALQTA